ncbi:hypothetical protein [Microvirga massiliensis]|uniref:hypothetical protein n=1 Tax=Microvirga massiliensis TaxID=1033741 RepID=UPI00062B588B|nr:hypothetical protein [Microvirga massiliensis]
MPINQRPAGFVWLSVVAVTSGSPSWLITTSGLVVLITLILVTIAILHTDAHLAQAATMLIFATAVAICLTPLMIYDRPLAVGSFTMTPAVLREVVPD